MSERAGRPTPEVYMMQKELEKARTELRQEQALADQDKLYSNARIHEEMGRSKDMVRRFEEQTLQQRDMNREVSDLRQQLFHFKQGKKSSLQKRSSFDSEKSFSVFSLVATGCSNLLLGLSALNNEMYRNPKVPAARR